MDQYEYLLRQYRLATKMELTDENIIIVLEELLPHLSLEGLDLVLVEGFKHESLPKIELHRPSLGKPYLFPNVPGIIALATDIAPREDIEIPVLDLNKIDEIAEFIMGKYSG